MDAKKAKKLGILQERSATPQPSEEKPKEEGEGGSEGGESE